ncbi:hypothetical protein EJ02DRAFT_67627 [Clathrospora elynae]|uniref:Uncharacterized protein n=1 Tax=Clathrospora elynae TaxID=706981 RepID=A0A6A5SZK9_9PLEO|nr:hypothetical protein EJ02DRAFT_67627 [Clathrospora elynae]
MIRWLASRQCAFPTAPLSPLCIAASKWKCSQFCLHRHVPVGNDVEFYPLPWAGCTTGCCSFARLDVSGEGSGVLQG